MATRCFCGCGRKARFSKKRVSEWGAETDQILQALEAVSLPLVRDHPEEQRIVQRFIDDGQQYRVFLRDLVHGEFPLPPGSDGSNYPEASARYTDEFLHWQAHAGGLVKSHLEAVNEARRTGEMQGAAEAMMPGFWSQYEKAEEPGAEGPKP